VIALAITASYKANARLAYIWNCMARTNDRMKSKVKPLKTALALAAIRYVQPS